MSRLEPVRDTEHAPATHDPPDGRALQAIFRGAKRT